MQSRFAALSARATLLLGTVFGASVLLASTPAAPVRALPTTSKISAVYKVRFAGMPLGNFRIASNVSGDQYSLSGQAKLTFLTGMIFELKGGSASSGTVSEAGPNPAAFSFSFKTKKGQGNLVMKFSGGAVSHVASQPPLKPSPKAVPVTAKHVTGVLDPLTALFFAAKATRPGQHSSVCDRRLPVYDGLYRFDLQLSHKQTVRVVKKKNKGGYAGPAVICRVKYIPVAGHRPHASNTVYMQQTDDIEVWLIPVPDGRTYVPYHVSIPTPYGTAQATSTAFQIETANQKKIALVP